MGRKSHFSSDLILWLGPSTCMAKQRAVHTPIWLISSTYLLVVSAHWTPQGAASLRLDSLYTPDCVCTTGDDTATVLKEQKQG